MSTSDSSRISTLALLRALGFTGEPSGSPPGFGIDLGPIKLSAMPHPLERVIMLIGHVAGKDSLTWVEYKFPHEFESIEQGMAWIAYSLSSTRADELESVAAREWLKTVEAGHRYRDRLPWERQHAAYQARPHCYVQRDWARFALKKLAEQFSAVKDDAPVTFAFDGTVLTIRCSGNVIPVPADGRSWSEPYSIRVDRMRSLPRRLVGQSVEISVWESELRIGNRRYPGVATLDADRSSPDVSNESPPTKSSSEEYSPTSMSSSEPIRVFDKNTADAAFERLRRRSQPLQRRVLGRQVLNEDTSNRRSTGEESASFTTVTAMGMIANPDGEFLPAFQEWGADLGPLEPETLIPVWWPWECEGEPITAQQRHEWFAENLKACLGRKSLESSADDDRQEASTRHAPNDPQRVISALVELRELLSP